MVFECLKSFDIRTFDHWHCYSNYSNTQVLILFQYSNFRSEFSWYSNYSNIWVSILLQFLNYSNIKLDWSKFFEYNVIKLFKYSNYLHLKSEFHCISKDSNFLNYSNNHKHSNNTNFKFWFCTQSNVPPICSPEGYKLPPIRPWLHPRVHQSHFENTNLWKRQNSNTIIFTVPHLPSRILRVCFFVTLFF